MRPGSDLQAHSRGYTRRVMPRSSRQIFGHWQIAQASNVCLTSYPACAKVGARRGSLHEQVRPGHW